MTSDRSDEARSVVVQSPEALMVQVAEGDEASFEQLYDQLAPKVYGLIRRLVRDEAQSEEVMQEVFVEAWQQAVRYDPLRGTATSWLLTLAHRRAVDRIRSSQAAREREMRIGVQNYQSSYDNIEEQAIVRAEAQQVAEAMHALTPAQRQAIELAYFEGCTHHEVAAVLHIPVGTAKTRIRDGMQKLRVIMGGV